MSKISFVKMHGLGNDFVIVDQNHLPPLSNLSLLATKIADRKTGIGCDQFIIYNNLEFVARGNYQMMVYNQDGSLAEICGNAARCLTLLIAKDTGLNKFAITTDTRKILCFAMDENIASINMGKVDFEKNWLPKNEDLWALAGLYGIEPKEMICADIGNPHLVIFSNLSQNDQAIIGAKMQEHPLFPGGINVNFAQVVDDKISLTVWERGAGFTLACGSGACATFASAIKLGFIEKTAEILFKLGNLQMTLNEEQNVMMSGPAKFIATGEFYVS